MLELFHRSGRKLQEQVKQLAYELSQLRGDVTDRLHQVEQECERIRLRRMLSAIHEAAQLAVGLRVPLAVEIGKGLRGMIAPFLPCKAGGLARARNAWRYADGTFMPESEKFEAYREEYERYAAGGRARARGAARSPEETFLPQQALKGTESRI